MIKHSALSQGYLISNLIWRNEILDFNSIAFSFFFVVFPFSPLRDEYSINKNEIKERGWNPFRHSFLDSTFLSPHQREGWSKVPFSSICSSPSSNVHSLPRPPPLFFYCHSISLKAERDMHQEIQEKSIFRSLGVRIIDDDLRIKTEA